MFFGGARGGGKTDGLLGDWMGHAALYGQHARGILFRRTLKELEDVIVRSREMYAPLGWKYREQKHEWVAPNGAILRLRYLDKDGDAAHYHGHAYTWMAFDELGNWPSPRPIDLLWGCLRSAHGVPCVRRSTGNPGGPGHAWVKKRYVDHGAFTVHEELFEVGDKTFKTQSVFIPSTLDDNKLLQQSDPGYEARLRLAGDEKLFMAWRFGDWSILAGQYFDYFDRTVHGVPRHGYRMETWHPRWMSMDWGYHDDAAWHCHRSDEAQKVVTYREMVVRKTTPENLGKAIVARCQDHESFTNFYLSRDAFHKRNSERTIADEIYAGIVVANAERVSQGKTEIFIPQPERCDDNRVGGWMLMSQMLQNGTWRIDRDECPVVVDALPLLVRDVEKNPEDCMESPVDHAPDSCRYGMLSRLKNGAQPVSSAIQRAAAIPDINERNMALLIAHAAASKAAVGVRSRRYR